MDAAGGHAARRALTEHRRAFRPGYGPGTEARTPADHCPGGAGHDVSHRYGSGVVGGRGPLRALAGAVRFLRHEAAGHLITGGPRRPHALVGDHRLFRLGGNRSNSADYRQALGGGIRGLRPHVADVRTETAGMNPLSIGDLGLPPDAEPDVVALVTALVNRANAAEAALRLSQEQLRLLAWAVGHDMSEPLRSIVSYNQLLERRYKGRLDEEADQFIA